jgi:hypothetical protein
MVDTSAIPTRSAEAVWAVRRGLRIEFSRPSFPEIPNRRARGRPITLAIGRATTGASIPMPMNTAKAPRPTSWIAGFDSPRTSTAMPISSMTCRRRSGGATTPGGPRGNRPARQPGGTRTARRAGLMAETTVTPIPTTRPTMTVRPSNTRAPDGRVTPNTLRSASRPSAARTPSPKPDHEARAPTMNASARTERNTCRRLAPTMRSRASSRVRWPTVIEKVLKMVNPPTNREMKAKTKSAVEKKDRAWLMSLAARWPPSDPSPPRRPWAGRPRWRAARSSCRLPAPPERPRRRSARPRRRSSGPWAG